MTDTTLDRPPVGEMTFDDLMAEREEIKRLAQGSLDALPNDTVRRLADITSRLRSMSSTSRPPKQRKRPATLEDIA